MKRFLNSLSRRWSETRGHSTRNPSQSASLRLEQLEVRQVLSLTGIAPNAGFPFTTIVELQATFPDHKTFDGSGVMVDRFHVLTAGHVLYDYAEGGFASQILAIPELYGNSEPFGTAHMTYERTYPAFTNYDKAHPGKTAAGDDDIGLITLDYPVGDRTGWMSYGYDNNNADFAKGVIYNTAGYPAAGGYDGHHMEFSSGPLAGLSADGSALDYSQSSITTYGGQSGSPVWRYNASNNSRVVYGIHVGGSGGANSSNFATRITQSIFNDLQHWSSADTAPIVFLRQSQSANGSGSGMTPLAFAPLGNSQSAEIGTDTGSALRAALGSEGAGLGSAITLATATPAGASLGTLSLGAESARSALDTAAPDRVEASPEQAAPQHRSAGLDAGTTVQDHEGSWRAQTNLELLAQDWVFADAIWRETSGV